MLFVKNHYQKLLCLSRILFSFIFYPNIGRVDREVLCEHDEIGRCYVNMMR